MRGAAPRTHPRRPGGWLVPFVAAAVMAASVAVAPSVAAAGGDLDPSFGVGGRAAVLPFGSSRGGNGIAFQTDGKIVVAGAVPVNPDWTRQRFAVARFDVDGTLDPTFGGDGFESTIFQPGTKCYEDAKAVVVQSDGRIVAAGLTSCRSGWAGHDGPWAFALARYNVDGTPDPTFGDNGAVITNFGTPARHSAEVTALAPRARRQDRGGRPRGRRLRSRPVRDGRDARHHLQRQLGGSRQTSPLSSTTSTTSSCSRMARSWPGAPAPSSWSTPTSSVRELCWLATTSTARSTNIRSGREGDDMVPQRTVHGRERVLRPGAPARRQDRRGRHRRLRRGV